MPRRTIAELKEACQMLTELTGDEYLAMPIGSGFWYLRYRLANGQLQDVTNRRIGELIDFMDAYRRGYGRCLDRQKERAATAPPGFVFPAAAERLADKALCSYDFAAPHGLHVKDQASGWEKDPAERELRRVVFLEKPGAEESVKATFVVRFGPDGHIDEAYLSGYDN